MDKRIEEAKAGLAGEGGADAPAGKKKKKGKGKWTSLIYTHFTKFYLSFKLKNIRYKQ